MLPQRRRLKLQLSTRSTEELQTAGTGLKERNEDWGCADTPDEEPLGHVEQPDLHPSAPIVGAGVPEHVGGTPPPPPHPDRAAGASPGGGGLKGPSNTGGLSEHTFPAGQ